MAFPTPFPKIPSYRREADLLGQVRRVVCLEKIDGTNTRIGVPAGAQTPDEIVAGGRSLLPGDDGFNQDFLVELIRRDGRLCRRLLALSAELGVDIELYGETCGARIQQLGLLYGSRTHLLLFAARLGGVWTGFSTAPPPPPKQAPLRSVQQLAEALGVPTVPCLYTGPPDPAVLDALRSRPSQHSIDQGFSRADVDQTHEGIVIWSDPVLLAPWGDPVVAKHKPPHRQEARHISDAALLSPEAFAESAVLPERLRHARQHLEEQGRWDSALGSLSRRVIQDVAREVPSYQAHLRAHGKRAVRAALKARVRALAPGVLDPS